MMLQSRKKSGKLTEGGILSKASEMLFTSSATKSIPRADQ